MHTDLQLLLCSLSEHDLLRTRMVVRHFLRPASLLPTIPPIPRFEADNTVRCGEKQAVAVIGEMMGAADTDRR